MHSKSRNVLSPIPEDKKKNPTGGWQRQVGSAPLLKHPWRILKLRPKLSLSLTDLSPPLSTQAYCQSIVCFSIFARTKWPPQKTTSKEHSTCLCCTKTATEKNGHLSLGQEPKRYWITGWWRSTPPEPLCNLGEDDWHSHLWDTLATVQMMLSLLSTWAIVKKKCFIVLQHWPSERIYFGGTSIFRTWATSLRSPLWEVKLI